MRIALFSGNYNYLREGANQALNRLVDHLEKAGGVVRVYSPVTRTPAFEPSGTLVPVPSIALPVRNEFRLALGLNRLLRDDIRAFAPDLFHVSTPDILNSRAQTLAKKLDVPIVASMHTRFETYLEHYRLGWLRPPVEAHLRRFYRRSDHVVAPTSALVEEIGRMRGDDHVSLWSRGVDRSQFNPAQRDPDWRRAIGLADDEIALLFFGRLVLEKGVRTYMEVVRALLARGARVRALVVGAGPAAAELEGIPEVLMAGHLEGESLARAVASADIMVTPSTTETFGNVILEAMASGLLVASADAPNARALLVDGETGLLCAPLNAEDYADRIMTLIECPDRRRAIGAAARKASASFSWGSACENVVRAYESVLTARPRPLTLAA